MDVGKQLLIDCVTVSVAANGTTSGQYVLLSGHGSVVKVAALLSDNTLADLAACQLTVQYNNSNVINNLNGIALSQSVFGIQRSFPVDEWIENSTIQYSLINGSATAMVLALLFYYVNDGKNSEMPSENIHAANSENIVGFR